MTPGLLPQAMHNNKDQRLGHRHRRVWILGAGRFGKIAVKRIRHHIADAEITVVDQSPSSQAIDAEMVVPGDGVAWLVRNLTPETTVDMVVPAIPVHVAAGWLRMKLADRFTCRPIEFPDTWIEPFPNPMRATLGQVFVSHADFICPDNCPEPPTVCTHTGLPRPMDMFRLLAAIKTDDCVPIVLRSHQILPGVGGLLPADLFAAMQTAIVHAEHPLMIATACRCHGVVDFMRLEANIE
jgi:hypothetical protein